MAGPTRDEMILALLEDMAALDGEALRIRAVMAYSFELHGMIPSALSAEYMAYIDE